MFIQLKKYENSQIESIFRCQNIYFNRGFSGGTSCYLSERWRFESHNRDVAEATESSSSIIVSQMALPGASTTDAKAVEIPQTY